MRWFRASLALGFGLFGGLVVAMASAAPALARTSALYSTEYTLEVRNNSTSVQDFVVYQSDPNLNANNASTLAWFVAPLKANARTDLSWNPDYSVSLSDSADLKVGAVYRPAQTLPVSPGAPGDDGVDLSYIGGVLGMDRAKSLDQSKGTLSLEEPRKIPRDDGSVALGMAGRPAFAWKAEPNHTLRFTPHPEYWITAGDFTQGEVINPQTVSNPLPLHFGKEAALKVTLHEGGHWTVS